MATDEPIGDRAQSTFLTLRTTQSRHTAQKLLNDSDADFAVILDENDAPAGLARRSSAADMLNAATTSVRDLLNTVAPALVAGTDQPASSVVRAFSDDLDGAPEILGLLVLDKQHLIGVVSRETLEDVALSMFDTERGAGDFALPGFAQVAPAYFRCPASHYRELLSRYDPSNPPKCPIDGQLLQRK